MERAGICSKLRHAVLQELPCRMRFSCMGTVWDGLSPSKGGRQGGCDTPFLWNVLLRDALVKARVRWRSGGLGWTFDPNDVFAREAQKHIRDVVGGYEAGWVPFMAWADDLVLLGRSEHEARMLWEILSQEIHKLGLTWKAGSLELYMAGRPADDELRTLDWSCDGIHAVVREVRSLVLLGILISATASDADAAKYRITQAWTHFHTHAAKSCATHSSPYPCDGSASRKQ
jgi:hypothetical protein